MTAPSSSNVSYFGTLSPFLHSASPFTFITSSSRCVEESFEATRGTSTDMTRISTFRSSLFHESLASFLCCLRLQDRLLHGILIRFTVYCCCLTYFTFLLVFAWHSLLVSSRARLMIVSRHRPGRSTVLLCACVDKVKENEVPGAIMLC